VRLGSLGVLAGKRSRCFIGVLTSEPCLVPRSGATDTDGYASIRFVPARLFAPARRPHPGQSGTGPTFPRLARADACDPNRGIRKAVVRTDDAAAKFR
jgi:hypothetical protein